MNNSTALSISYLSPIQYFVKLISYEKILIESEENYTKQSYRNRCAILGANGKLILSIPVIKTQGNHTPIKLIEIDNSVPWQKIHWRSIESAYRSSAYFDFVSDFLFPFYSKRYDSLFEFDLLLMQSILDFLSIKPNIHYTESFRDLYEDGTIDFRNEIHPKVHFYNDFEPVKYFQVFSDKYGFVPNLSIIDLLFNEGLSSINVLNESKNKPIL